MWTPDREQKEPSTKEYCCLCCNEVDEKTATILDMTDKKQGLEYICDTCKYDYSHCAEKKELENEVAGHLNYLNIIRQDIKHYTMKYKHGDPFKLK